MESRIGKERTSTRIVRLIEYLSSSFLTKNGWLILDSHIFQIKAVLNCTSFIEFRKKEECLKSQEKKRTRSLGITNNS